MKQLDYILLFMFIIYLGLIINSNKIEKFQAYNICERTGCDKIEVNWGIDYDCNKLKKKYNLKYVLGNEE